MALFSFFAHPRKVLGLATCLAGLCGILTHVARGQEPAPASISGYRLDATWKPGGDGGWDYLTADAPAHRLYVTRTDRVQVLDTDKGTLVGEVPGLDGGHGVALAPEFGRGFATSGKSNTVVVFDLQTLKPTGEPVRVGQKPDAILYDPASQHVFAFNGESHDASVIDAVTSEVVTTIPLGGAPEFPVTDGKSTLFVNLEDKSETLAIDVQKNAVIHRWPLAPGDSPTGLAFDAVRRRLYVGCRNEQMMVLDADGGTVLGSVPIGQGVDACAFDPATGLAFASCGNGTLTVAKEEPAGTFHRVEQIETRPGARTMALNPQTHAIYLAAADFEPVPTPAPDGKRARPKMIPGTFAVLKFIR